VWEYPEGGGLVPRQICPDRFRDFVYTFSWVVIFPTGEQLMGKDAKFIVRLDAAEQQHLQALVDEGRGSKSVRQRARVLLKADQAEGAPGWTDERVAEFAEVSLSTVHRVRQEFVEEGLESTLRRRPSLQRQYRKLDGAAEAKLIATACSQAPEGRSRWTLHLLADKLVELQVVNSISRECVRTTLKKTNFSRIARSSG
jgi:transposase